MVQTLSRRIFFEEKVEFLKSGIWIQFYASYSPGTIVPQNVKVPYRIK